MTVTCSHLWKVNYFLNTFSSSAFLQLQSTNERTESSIIWAHVKFTYSSSIFWYNIALIIRRFYYSHYYSKLGDILKINITCLWKKILVVVVVFYCFVLYLFSNLCHSYKIMFKKLFLNAILLRLDENLQKHAMVSD